MNMNMNFFIFFSYLSDLLSGKGHGKSLNNFFLTHTFVKYTPYFCVVGKMSRGYLLMHRDLRLCGICLKTSPLLAGLKGLPVADAVTQCTASSAEEEMIFSKAGMVCIARRISTAKRMT